VLQARRDARTRSILPLAGSVLRFAMWPRLSCRAMIHILASTRSIHLMQQPIPLRFAGPSAQSRKRRSSWLTPAFTCSTWCRHSTLLTFLHALEWAEELSTAIQRAPCSLRATRADSVFYLQSGRLKVTVVSANGKEATITLLSAGDFIGEDSLTGTAERRSATVTAITSSYAMKITQSEMIRVMHDEHAFSDLFLSHLLARSMRTQADLVDQLFNSSEKRLQGSSF
jgi:hypothetical protein